MADENQQNASTQEAKKFTEQDVNKIVSERVNKSKEQIKQLQEQLQPFLDKQKEAEEKAKQLNEEKLKIVEKLNADELQKLIASKNAPQTKVTVVEKVPEKTYRFVDPNSIKNK